MACTLLCTGRGKFGAEQPFVYVCMYACARVFMRAYLYAAQYHVYRKTCPLPSKASPALHHTTLSGLGGEAREASAGLVGHAPP